jgi:hypothetical protein
MATMPRPDLASSLLATPTSPNGAKSSVANAISTCTLSRSVPHGSPHKRQLTDAPQAKPKNKMHTDPEKLSHHVHRVGHHFPLTVITLACSKFGYVYDDKRSLRKEKARDRDNWIAQQVENYSSRQLPRGGLTTEKGTRDHTRGAVREMFPKIPEADLSAIINHAFEEVFSLHLCLD